MTLEPQYIKDIIKWCVDLVGRTHASYVSLLYRKSQSSASLRVHLDVWYYEQIVRSHG